MSAPQTKRSPAATGLRDRTYRTSGSNPSTVLSPIHQLKDRLEGIRVSGRGWIARCPGHTDRSASLSLAEGDDGRILLHCFAGCSVADVMAAVGLSVADLFPQRLTANMSASERNALREHAKQSQWKAALNVLLLEVGVVHIAARQLAAGEALSADDLSRVGTACDRIRDAREVLHGRY